MRTNLQALQGGLKVLPLSQQKGYALSPEEELKNGNYVENQTETSLPAGTA